MASAGPNVFPVNLANKLGTEWSTLGLLLGLDWSRVNLLRAQHAHNLLDAIQAMLQEWWAGAGHKTAEEKKQQLISALRECGRVDLAEDIRKGRIAVQTETARGSYESSSSSEESLDFPVQDSAGAAAVDATVNLTSGVQTLTLTQQSESERPESPPPVYPIRPIVGHALIINNIKFPTESGRNRKGMEKDSANLEAVLQRLGFSVKVKIDLNSTEMKDAIRKFINKNHSQSTCLLLSVMTHGKDQEAMGTDWKGIGINKDIILPIVKSDNIPCPKVFILQMCRGGERDVGVRKARWGVDDAADAVAMRDPQDSDSDSSSEEESTPESAAFQVDWAGVCSKLAPTDVDYIVTWACAEGKVSLRSRKQGSVLIQQVVRAFDKYGQDEDVATMFERVRRNVAKVEANLREENRETIVKQSAETKTHLLGKLYFKSSSSSA